MALSGCATRYICGVPKTPQAVVGGEHYSMSPYVKLIIGDDKGTTITVGNESAPSLGNDAVIRDFEYGSGDGITAKFTIHDQRGGSLTKFIERMLIDFTKATAASVEAEFEYGWITSGCPQPVSWLRSTRRSGTIIEADTNFAEGKFMYTLTVKSVAETMAESKHDKIYGEDGEKGMPIRLAIEKLLTDASRPPAVAKVSFLTMQNGQVQPVGFQKPKQGDKNGKKGKWPSNNRGKIQTALNWLIQDNLSQNGKAWYPYYNESVKGGEIIFWEDNQPLCNEGINPKTCVGTYVVNGGKESSVIEFNPQFRWSFNLLTTGGTVGENKTLIYPDSDTPGKLRGRGGCDSLQDATRLGAGAESGVPVIDTTKDENGEGAAEKVEKNIHLAARANSYTIHDAIEADLVVIGDPDLDPVRDGHGAFVSIIFINPFHLIGTSGGCPEWLSSGLEGTPCNELLSNRGWQTISLGHRITGGKYTSNLRIRLAVPGIAFDVGTSLGATQEGKKL